MCFVAKCVQQIFKQPHAQNIQLKTLIPKQQYDQYFEHDKVLRSLLLYEQNFYQLSNPNCNLYTEHNNELYRS